MWAVRWILGAIIIIAILGFALQNQDQTAAVTILKWQSPQMPLYILLYIAFGIGLLFWAVVSIMNILKLKGSILKLQKENRKVKAELNRLRNIDIDELAPPEPEEVTGENEEEEREQ